MKKRGYHQTSKQTGVLHLRDQKEREMKGQCLCGAVQYELHGPVRPVMACHCTQCRKTSGHYVAATQVKTRDLSVEGEESLTWYQSSSEARRAFCSTCGSQLFWRPIGGDVTSIMAGTLDGKTGLVMEKQIYCENKGDYYDLPLSASAKSRD